MFWAILAAVDSLITNPFLILITKDSCSFLSVCQNAYFKGFWPWPAPLCIKGCPVHIPAIGRWHRLLLIEADKFVSAIHQAAFSDVVRPDLPRARL